MKKICAVILASILLFTYIIPAQAQVATSYETNKTIDVASYDRFRRATVGKAYDMDGYWGAQCWDGVQLFYKNIGMNLSTGGYGYAKYCWLDANARATNTGSKFIQITDKTKIKRGDVVVLNQYSNDYPSGHIAFADEDYDTSGYLTLYGQNQSSPNDSYGCPFDTHSYPVTMILGAFRYKGWYGTEMTAGYDRVLPDGNYMIAHAGDTSFFLDIKGSTAPAANGTNVQLYQTTNGDIPDSDAWTITYSNGFYKVAQYGKAVSLDVSGGSTFVGKNVQAWSSVDTASAQKWAISKNGKNGYRLEAKCSGLSLDIADGTIAKNTNIQQWLDNSSNAQSWVFIPYKPSQPISNGRYILLYTPNQSYELDVSGDTGDISDGTNVRLWSDTAPSRYNSFDLSKLDNGYYKIKHAASGKYLTVAGGSTTYKANVEVRSDNGSNSQQWAIVGNGSGYSLISKANGYALDLPSGVTGDSKNVETYPRLGNDNQRWTFVQAEHTVQYNANGGSGAPGAQTKYYKNGLTLSSARPTKAGFEFVGWSEDPSATNSSYQPGDTYTSDKNTTLYAVWKDTDYTLSFDMNGGNGSIAPIHMQNGGPCTIPEIVPTRTGYVFLGWSEISNTIRPTYKTGDSYPGGTATLYAVWYPEYITITFDSNGAGSYSPQAVQYGNPIGGLPVPKKGGYYFKGWFTASGERVTVDTVVTEDLALTARWSEPSRMVLPDHTTTIEDEAFIGTSSTVVIIPDKVTSIGAKAFADNDSLFTVVVYSRSLTVAPGAFENCPNLTVYGYANTPIEYYCTSEGIPFTALDGGFIPDSELPVGATVTDEKWIYTKSTLETTTSPETSLAGWIKLDEFSWEKTGTGTYKYASYPSGFDTGSSLYSKYNKSKLSSSSTETTKREVSNASFLTYIYWHWTFVDSVNADHASGGHNVFIRNARLLHENVSGSVYRDFIYFDAFESTGNQGTVGPTGTSTTYDIGTEGGYYYWRNNNADASQWWWRLNVYQQTYTDYRKIFTYFRTTTEECESSTPVEEDGIEISNVRHLVKFGF